MCQIHLTRPTFVREKEFRWEKAFDLRLTIFLVENLWDTKNNNRKRITKNKTHLSNGETAIVCLFSTKLFFPIFRFVLLWDKKAIVKLLLCLGASYRRLDSSNLYCHMPGHIKLGLSHTFECTLTCFRSN